MLFLVLFISIKSYIPREYRQLVTEALKSAEIKTPKELREDTKYPGIYEGERHHFRLTKILTSAKTKDIKGFAFTDHHCAIVKRKQFKLQDGFTVADPKTQSIYLLHKSVASEDKVIVYESQKINIFHIMTDFKLESSTDEYINSLPLSSKERVTLRPKAELSYPYHWDEERDRPELEELNHTNVQAGVGYILKLGFSTSISFNSIWDISISARITLEGKWGVEVLIPDDCEIQIPDYEFLNKKFEIPQLGYSFKFLGIDISIGLFINFAIELTDMKIVIPLSFDYLKGHYFIATKYYEITPNSIVDSKWELTFNELPAADNIKEVIKNFNLDDIKFLATFQFRPFFTLEFNVGEIGTTLELGIKLPFVFTFSFDKKFCNFPFIKADVTFPVAMYYNFEGIKINDYELISEKYDDYVFYEHTFPTFCIGKRRITTGSNNDDDDDDDDSKYTVGYYITHNDIYEQRNGNTPQVRKQISVEAVTKELYIFDKHTYPLALYQDANHKTQSDMFTYLIGHVARDKLRWTINYVDNNNMVSSDYYFEQKTSEMKFNEKNEITIPVQINKKNNDNSDITYLNANIEKTPFILINRVFRRKSKHITYYCTEVNRYSYSLLIIDDNGERKFDEQCTFLPQYANSEDFAVKGRIYNGGYDYEFYLTNTTVTIDNGVSVEINIIENYVKDGAQKNLLFANLIIPLVKGENIKYDTDPNEKLYAYDLYIPEEASISFNGKVHLNDGSEQSFNIDLDLSFDIALPNKYITIQIIEGVSFTFIFARYTPLFLVSTSYENPYPISELIVSVADVKEFTDSKNAPFYTFQIPTEDGEDYKVLRFEIPEEYRQSKLYVHFTFEYDGINFLDNRVYQVSEDAGFIDIKGEEVIELLIVRTGKRRLDHIIGRYSYSDYSQDGLIISPEGVKLTIEKTIVKSVLVPFYYGSTSVIFYFDTMDGKTSYFSEEINDYALLHLFNNDVDNIGCTLLQTTIGIGDEEPYLSYNLTIYQDYVNRYNKLEFHVNTINGKYVRCIMNNITTISEVVKKKANFTFTGEMSNAVFSSICENESGIACEINYPEPNMTGFHLINYPNRDGISTTGKGFLAELIQVEKGKSFVYYKNYNETIKKVREYTLDPIDIELKIIDQRKANYMNMKRIRKICLYDPDNKIVPFSRKYANEDIFRFIDNLGISKDIDFNYFTNDENGCIIFDPKYIASNEFNNITADICDLNINNNITVNKDELIFDVGGVDKKNNIKTIIIIVVAIVVVVVVIVIIVAICIIKKKKRKQVQNGSALTVP